MDNEPMFGRVVIVGLGLMGGSLAMALKQKNIAQTVWAVDNNVEALRYARETWITDTGITDIRLVDTADLVVFAVPVSLIVPLMIRAAPYIRPDAIVTDLASVKAQIQPIGERLFGSRYVGSHPMAGSEKKGVMSARADLFEGAAWFLIAGETPETLTNRYTKILMPMVERCGAQVVLATAEKHDQLVALVSHVPHALAFGFARAVEQSETPGLARSVAGGSFRDIMRVAGANPALWADILFSNREALKPALDSTLTEIERVRELLNAPDATKLRNYLEGKR